MKPLEYRQYYRRHLPHIVPPDATFFVTFRLADSIPKTELRVYHAKMEWFENEAKRLLRLGEDSPEMAAHSERLLVYKREWFVKFEDILHQARIGPEWLKDERIAAIVVESLHFLDNRSYTLNAYCVMSNHVHAIFKPLLIEEEPQEAFDEQECVYIESNHPSLARLMKSLKGYTAREANRILGRKGRFWEPETYDHYVRDAAEFERIVAYILNNPVKAGLVENWHEWRWSYRRG